jgi:hypothetical protein
VATPSAATPGRLRKYSGHDSGFIAVAWYGVQTFLVSSALVIVAGLFFVRDGARSQLAGQLFLVCWCRRRRPVLPNVDSASAVCGVHRHGGARLAGLGRRDLRPVGMSSGSSATVCNMASESSAAQDVPFCFTSAGHLVKTGAWSGGMSE